MPTLQEALDTGLVPPGTYDGKAVIRRTGTYTFAPGVIVKGSAVDDGSQVIDWQAPDCTIVGLDGSGIRRSQPDAYVDDLAFPAFVKVRAEAKRGTLRDCRFDDLDAFSVDCYANDFRAEGIRGTHCNGIRFVRCSRGVAVDCSFPVGDRMLRNTPRTVRSNDDVGGVAFNFYETPRGPVRHLIENFYVADARAKSYDYDLDGAAFEFWQASSVEIRNGVALDCDNILETGAKSGTCEDVHIHGNLFGATKSGGPYRGLMLRPVIDWLIEGNDYFGLEHWHLDINHGGGSFSAGATRNLVFRNERHAATRADRPIAQQGTGYVIEPSVSVSTGAAAATLAVILQADSYRRRDAILAASGLPKEQPVPTPDPLAELELRLADAEEAIAGVVAALQADDGPFSLLTGRVEALEAPRDTAEAERLLGPGPVGIETANPKIARAIRAVLDVAKG